MKNLPRDLMYKVMRQKQRITGLPTIRDFLHSLIHNQRFQILFIPFSEQEITSSPTPESGSSRMEVRSLLLISTLLALTHFIKVEPKISKREERTVQRDLCLVFFQTKEEIKVVFYCRSHGSIYG